MKDINKGLGFLAAATVTIVAIIVTKSISDNILLLSALCFGIVACTGNNK